MAQWEQELEAAVAAARAGGEAALAHFEKSPEVSWKLDRSPVSAADHAADHAIRARLAESFPDDAILTEESGETAGRSGRRWIVDPVDGTRSFLRGLPYWSNLVALEAAGDIVAGVAHLPALGRLYAGGRGLGAWRDGRRLAVRTVSQPDQACLVIGELDHVVRGLSPSAFQRLIETVELVRVYGDGYGPSTVLDGRTDAWLEHEVSLWDLAPFVVLLEEAGARFTDLDGRRIWPTHTGLAARPGLHEALLELIRPERGRAGGGPSTVPC